MMKMEIHLDEKKIIADDEYEPSTIYEAVDRVFKDCKLIKGENGFYYGKDSDKDFSRFGAAIGVLDEMEWFMKYVDKWLWYISDESDDPEDFEVEDLIETYKEELKVIHNEKK